MNQSVFTRRNAQLVVVLITAAAVKFYYSTASVNQLRWILAPTAFLVEHISGRRFSFESYAGYMSNDHSFLIAASCAGVNFLITSFLMLSLTRLWSVRTRPLRWRLIPVAAVLAYLTTIVANTVRISVALYLQQKPLDVSWLSGNELHRLEGIAIYSGFLVLLYCVSEKCWVDDSSFLRRFLFPLLVYYAVTLGIPMVNGAYRQGSDFLEHAFFVISIPLLVIMVIESLHMFAGQLKQKSFSRKFCASEETPSGRGQMRSCDSVSV